MVCLDWPGVRADADRWGRRRRRCGREMPVSGLFVKRGFWRGREVRIECILFEQKEEKTTRIHQQSWIMVEIKERGRGRGRGRGDEEDLPYRAA